MRRIISKLTKSKLVKYFRRNYFYTDPKRVKYIITNAQFNEYGLIVKPGIIYGDWDRLKKPLNETLIFKGFWNRFCNGKDWQDTELYEKLSIVHPSRLNKLGGIQQYCKHYDKLYYSILNNGYDNSILSDPIKVHIGRDGSLIRCDGLHRLVISQIIGIPTVKVETVMVHPLFSHSLADYQVKKRYFGNPCENKFVDH